MSAVTSRARKSVSNSLLTTILTTQMRLRPNKANTMVLKVAVAIMGSLPGARLHRATPLYYQRCGRGNKSLGAAPRSGPLRSPGDSCILALRRKTMNRKMNRREFIVKGSSVVLGAGLAANAGPVFGRPAADAGSGRVVEVFGPGAVLADRVVDPAIARKMLRRGMEKLTGSSNPWGRFLSPTDRVGLKINALGRPLLYTHHELIAAMVAELDGVRDPGELHHRLGPVRNPDARLQVRVQHVGDRRLRLRHRRP